MELRVFVQRFVQVQRNECTVLAFARTELLLAASFRLHQGASRFIMHTFLTTILIQVYIDLIFNT